MRRRNLPQRPSDPVTHCDEYIGRFCYWFEDGAPDDPPEPEPRAIQEGRERLIRALDSAAVALPGDDWIAGQRVRYLLEAGRLDAALGAARECRAAPWWCEALAGLAFHRMGSFRVADSAYASALRKMPADERCRWTDISVLLDGALARRYRDLPCDERGDIEARVWRLSPPLLMLSDSAGNDRRTEHFARVTMARLAEHAATPYGVPWGDDLREITLRYGWPTWWSQDERDPMRTPFDVSVTGHDHPAMHFLPSIDTGVAWSPNVRRPRETYAPVYLKSIGPLDYQRARFRREDACLLVAAFDPRRDTLLSIGPIDLALAIAPDDSTPALVERRAGAGSGSTSWITASAGCGSLTASIEAYAPGRHHAARARFTVPALASDREPPPGHLAISDLLLLDAASARADSLPGDLAAALSLVRGSTTVVATGALGLYWELYGLDPGGERVTTALTVSPQHVGWLRRMTASLGVAGLPTPVRIEWTEVAGRTPRAGRAIAVNLAGIGSGDYEIEIRARTARSEAVARRRVHIVR